MPEMNDSGADPIAAGSGRADRDEFGDREPTALERDVLLATSGELPWWRRATLARRLRTDPEARALAETAALFELVAPPARSKSPVTAPRVVLAVALAALVAVVLEWTVLEGTVPGSGAGDSAPSQGNGSQENGRIARGDAEVGDGSTTDAAVAQRSDSLADAVAELRTAITPTAVAARIAAPRAARTNDRDRTRREPVAHRLPVWAKRSWRLDR